MKFQVDPELCVGSGACENACPEVFQIVDNKAQVQIDDVSDELKEKALQAEEECPLDAISHQE